MTQRVPIRVMVLLGLLAGILGCGTGPRAAPDAIWGERGVLDGMLARPRAITIDAQDRLYVVDFTARIQVFDLDGNYRGPTWTTPDFRNGRPSGLGTTRDGNLIVCDSHYHCLRIYSPSGELLDTFGGQAGSRPGEFGYISDAVQDADGFIYLSEFDPNHRISKLDASGKFVATWGRPGIEPGEFSRLRALALGPDGLLYAADACNHRIQVFTKDGQLVRIFGGSGSEPGQLQYPYDLAFDAEGMLIVAEYGNHRVQRFSPTGESLGIWGSRGRQPGQLANPWALAVDRFGRVHIVDTENHRVQRIRF
ncbi:NHL repeat-containing protein [Tuwongella immobilis]|uniref:SMP-30/Gluconolactonase/LRE-like region domain-containing protein n=1 Tax=Tuwongella immobilis TaxID=692036 RepID=A0A6C2YLS3_9BACT|nr:NHL repeat-containing protein [Tuwongella immobilis]VIP02530.1 nhl repeat containing protein : Ring finger protein OS=Blastopirellula marina DSM 3645 GN=DSM3645_08622 PE=4 SV=1: NHL: NHL [Tuwongella immobilis]VTS01679.1 nhl repeat containing protein : Ring finger protein OS=Blastopirellula marina DSM 3645 GN=DSM3645_08622 PE=4 SV=1: NHL: NHL [Tuwongella immobilis]